MDAFSLGGDYVDHYIYIYIYVYIISHIIQLLLIWLFEFLEF